MTPFYDLSFFQRSLFGLWAFLICCTGIAGILISFAFRRYRYAVFSFVSFAASYFLWQVIFNIYRFDKTELASPVSMALGGFPWFAWLLALIPVTFAALRPIYLNIRYSRTAITPITIRQCGDRMNCGICFWLDSGRVVFSNICMNRLCLALTDEQLLNGNAFHEAVSDGLRHIGDEVWNFTCRELEYEGSILHEMIAWDVTELHAKTETLKKDNEELSRMTDTLKAYTYKIDDIVRRQEILQAKANIHNEMNRLMLSTVAADREDTKTLDGIFSQWKQNALLLCMEAEGNPDRNTPDTLYGYARLLNIQLVWDGTLPESFTEKQRELFCAAAQEAIINAVKHGEADKLTVSFEKDGTDIRCVFENGGSITAGEVQFTGGLANLAVLAEEQNAVLSAQKGETFRLSLLFRGNN